MIEESIVTPLPGLGRDFAPTVPLAEIVNAILYKIKTDICFNKSNGNVDRDEYLVKSYMF